MNTPLLVRAYDNGPGSPSPSRRLRGTLPPIASFTFAEILRSADSTDFQSAIDGIAEICAKNHMSLAHEYASHLPPLGEITATSSATAGPLLRRPGMRRPLTSVPEASSGSSEGSARTKRKRSGFFFLRPQRAEHTRPLRTMQIGSMGRTVSVTSTTAVSDNVDVDAKASVALIRAPDSAKTVQSSQGTASKAACSLQDLLDRPCSPELR